MPIDWDNTAVAMASRLQFDQACRRNRLLTEDYSRMVLAECIQPYVGSRLDPECNHPDLPGDRRIDLVVTSPRANTIETVIEHKWIRETTAAANRNWMSEILTDLLRVEAVNARLVQGAERVLIVAGEVAIMQSEVWGRRANAGGRRERVVDALLQRFPVGRAYPASHRVTLRRVGAPFKALLRQGADRLYAALPAAYDIQVVGYHRTRDVGIECVIWRVSRPRQQRVTFDGAIAWP